MSTIFIRVSREIPQYFIVLIIVFILVSLWSGIDSFEGPSFAYFVCFGEVTEVEDGDEVEIQDEETIPASCKEASPDSDDVDSADFDSDESWIWQHDIEHDVFAHPPDR